MTFEKALARMKLGAKCHRKGWVKLWWEVVFVDGLLYEHQQMFLGGAELIQVRKLTAVSVIDILAEDWIDPAE